MELINTIQKLKDDLNSHSIRHKSNQIIRLIIDKSCP